MKRTSKVLLAVAAMTLAIAVSLILVQVATSKPTQSPPSCSPDMVWNGAVCMLDESGIG
jgi:hypothetical protein